MDTIIFNKNELTLENVFKLTIDDDTCKITEIYFTFEDSSKVALFFDTVGKICKKYHINICYILADPKYKLNGILIDYSLYCLFNHSDNKFKSNGFYPCTNNQKYDIYNKDFVYSLGEREYLSLKNIYRNIKNKTILDVYLIILESISNIVNKNLIKSLNFNLLFKDILNYPLFSTNISLFLKSNKITFYTYIKLTG